MEPKIITREEIKLIGMQYIGNNSNGEIPKLWENFLPRIEEIKNQSGECVCYGVCECLCEGECKCGCGGDFSYIAAREVSSFDDVPEGMITRTIPASKYAVFTHKGLLESLNKTFEDIYSKWIPAAGLEIAGSYDFEYYDEQFKDFAPDSELDIYVPVK
ncbi:MAG TPA: GyrI-like domain-containing protein [Armatimonadota bacterium]|jgi:AraC family transcriptional regulator|nr:GyrI-like domain-containing protein [Armatimonadota bacterium]